MSLPPLPEGISGDQPNRLIEETLNDISVVLAEWPLYGTFKYKGDLWVGGSPGFIYSFPRTIRMYCDDEMCMTRQAWDTKFGPFINVSCSVVSDFKSALFRCRNCQRSSVLYYLHFEVNQIAGEITKVGQWPPLSREADPLVVSGWSKPDKLLYRDAITFRNANKGIAALPYLRRIIENHLSDILKLIGAANDRKSIPAFDLGAFEKIKASRRFSERLDFARDYPCGSNAISQRRATST